MGPLLAGHGNFVFLRACTQMNVFRFRWGVEDSRDDALHCPLFWVAVPVYFDAVCVVIDSGAV